MAALYLTLFCLMAGAIGKQVVLSVRGSSGVSGEGEGGEGDPEGEEDILPGEGAGSHGRAAWPASPERSATASAGLIWKEKSHRSASERGLVASLAVLGPAGVTAEEDVAPGPSLELPLPDRPLPEPLSLDIGKREGTGSAEAALPGLLLPAIPPKRGPAGGEAAQPSPLRGLPAIPPKRAPRGPVPALFDLPPLPPRQHRTAK